MESHHLVALGLATLLDLWHLFNWVHIMLGKRKQSGSLVRGLELPVRFWPFSWFRPKLESSSHSRRSLQIDSIMAWYLSLESGKLWFPAQVYNREVIGCN